MRLETFQPSSRQYLDVQLVSVSLPSTVCNTNRADCGRLRYQVLHFGSGEWVGCGPFDDHFLPWPPGALEGRSRKWEWGGDLEELIYLTSGLDRQAHELRREHTSSANHTHQSPEPNTPGGSQTGLSG